MSNPKTKSVIDGEYEMVNLARLDDAQSEFDSMMDILQHDPITITKNGKDLATLYPSQKVMEVAEALLEKNLLNSVKKGEMNVLEALFTQNRSVD